MSTPAETEYPDIVEALADLLLAEEERQRQEATAAQAECER